jgi:hypothetical protein
VQQSNDSLDNETDPQIARRTDGKPTASFDTVRHLAAFCLLSFSHFEHLLYDKCASHSVPANNSIQKKTTDLRLTVTPGALSIRPLIGDSTENRTQCDEPQAAKLTESTCRNQILHFADHQSETKNCQKKAEIRTTLTGFFDKARIGRFRNDRVWQFAKIFFHRVGNDARVERRKRDVFNGC